MTKPSPAPDDPPVLVLVPDETTRSAVLDTLTPLTRAAVATSPADAEAQLGQRTFGVLIIEDELPDETGVMFLARINDRHPWLRRILICGPLESDLLVFLINEANVFRCLTKPIIPAELRSNVLKALADHQRGRQLAQSAADAERLRAELASPRERARRAALFLRHWIASLPTIFLLMFLGAAWFFVLGVVVLLALYVLKSFVGIDLVEHMHLRDLFR